MIKRDVVNFVLGIIATLAFLFWAIQEPFTWLSFGFYMCMAFDVTIFYFLNKEKKKWE